MDDLIKEADDIGEHTLLEKAIELNKEARKLEIRLDNQKVKEIYSIYITEKVEKLSQNGNIEEYLSLIEALRLIEKLDLHPDLFDAQNIYFNTIYKRIPDLIENLDASSNKEKDRNCLSSMLKLGEKLNFDVSEFNAKLQKVNLSV